MQFQFSRLLRRGSIVRKVLVPTLCIAILVILLRLGTSSLTPPPETAQSYQPLTTPAAGAQQVKTGLYAVNVYNIDSSTNTYYADFYVWFNWKGEIDPIAQLEFVNGVEDWGTTQVPGYEEPQSQPDGSLYQIVRIESRFVQPFELTRYPLDEQQLQITLENSVYPIDQLVYIADTQDSGFADTLKVPGWHIEGFQLENLVHDYGTNFGQAGETSRYSTIRYSIEIARPLSFFVWKLLLPLLIVLLSSWCAFLLAPRFVDARTLMPITALLTIVFLQQSYSAGLPDVGYLVLLDKIYALAYVLIIAAILETIITADWIKDETPENEARVVKFDRAFLVAQLVILVGGLAILLA